MKNLPVNLRDEIDALYIAAYEALEKKDLNTAKEQAEKALAVVLAKGKSS